MRRQSRRFGHISASCSLISVSYTHLDVYKRQDKGVAKAADKKPSVREKLDRYKAAAKAEKEAERTVPEASKEKPKTPEANRQTVHRQPKKSKKPKER